MFLPAEAPLFPLCEELDALRRSMNTPVVSLEGLPVGPACAAVALHAGPPESPALTIAVRSVRTGQIAFFTAADDLRELRSPRIALDAALSFAESMGFLFDDDEVEARGEGGRREAARLWRELIDDGADAELPLSLAEAREQVARAASAAAPGHAPAKRERSREATPPALETGIPRPPERRPENARQAYPVNRMPGARPPAAPPWRPLDPFAPSPERTAAAAPVATPTRARRPPGEDRLLEVIAETAADRLVAPEVAPGLTKFRFRPFGAAASALRIERPRDAQDAVDGPAGADPPAAGGRGIAAAEDALPLRLLSRF